MGKGKKKMQLRKMKIIFSTYDDKYNPHYGGGGAIAIHELAKRLALKNDVTVLTGKYPGCKSKIIDKVEYKRIGLSMTGPKIGQLIYQFLLPFYVLSSKFDIWIESFTPPFSTACLQLFTKKPVIGLTHLLAAKDMSKKYWGIPFTFFERIGLKTYKYIIVLSEYLKNKIQDANKNILIKVIPNGIGKNLINQKPITNGKYILFIGRIDIEQKGLDMLLSAYKFVEKKINVPLLIAGSGAKKEENFLKKQICRLGLQRKVKYVGKVSGKKKIEVFKNSMFIVLPSRFESFPITILESFCFGLPVLIFDIPQLQWVSEKYCVRIISFDEKAYGEGILKLSKDNERRISMGKEAKKIVRKYSWSNIVSQYEFFFEEILSKIQA